MPQQYRHQLHRDAQQVSDDTPLPLLGDLDTALPCPQRLYYRAAEVASQPAPEARPGELSGHGNKHARHGVTAVALIHRAHVQ